MTNNFSYGHAHGGEPVDVNLSDFSDDIFEDCPDPHILGKIDNIFHGRNYGFVKPDVDDNAPSSSNYHFRWADENSDVMRGVKKGSIVHFSLKASGNHNKVIDQLMIMKDDGTSEELPLVQGQKPRPARSRSKSRNRRKSNNHESEPLFVGKPVNEREAGTSDLIGEKKGGGHTKTRERPVRLSGRVCDVKHGHMSRPFGFIEPENKLPGGYIADSQVRFYFSDVRPNVMPLRVGDRVEFILGAKDKTKAHATRVFVRSYDAQRSGKDMENIVTRMLRKLDNDRENVEAEMSLVDILNGPEAWQCIGNCADLTITAIETLMRLVDQLKEACSGLRSNFTSILQRFTKTRLFDVHNGRLMELISSLQSRRDVTKLEKVRQFLMNLAEFVPEKLGVIASLIKPMVSKQKTSLDYFLYRILRLAVKTNDPGTEDQEFTELPLVPSTNEIVHGPLEGAFNLQPIKPQGAYQSAEEYLEIYFRLLRADCFSAMNKGVRELLQGSLDHRDMNAYLDLKLYGVQLNERDIPIALAVKVKPFRPVRNWTRSRNFMFGNLVCISVNGRFTDSIWATVVSRDLLQNHQMVLLELCNECNTVSDAEAIQSLSHMGSGAVMVESPTYYRAYQPVLQSLQRKNPDTIPFQEELVQCDVTRKVPEFVNIESQLDGSCIYNDLKGKKIMEINEFLQFVSQAPKLDSSQEDAFKDCFLHRIAVIQGPPGTGKTFIGVKLVQALDTLSSKPETPILVLTYKNHALDEFMKAMDKMFPRKIARIGGRQQDGELNHCNLGELRSKTRKSKLLHEALSEKYQQIQNARETVAKALGEVHGNVELTFEMFLRHLKSQQMTSLLLKNDWTKTKLPSMLQEQADNGGFQTAIKKGKQKQKKLVTKAEVERVLRDIKCPVRDFLEAPVQNEKQKKITEAFLNMLEAAYKQWLPVANTFQMLRSELHGPVSDNLSKLFEQMTSDEPNKKKSGAADDAESDDDVDDEAEDAKAEENERLTATGTAPGAKVNLKNLIKFNDKVTSNSGAPALIPLPEGCTDNVRVAYLMNTGDLWSLPSLEKARFVQVILHREYEASTVEFTHEFAQYKSLFKSKAEIENLHSLEILRGMKVVGMTITGAGIYADIIEQLKPEIVMIEEAAEVIESQLLCCLGPWTKHLILIGDHKQLRPNVSTHKLRTDFNLDISMMERLINNGHFFSTLAKQNRMRPEFAELLKDIYPDLQNNLTIVSQNRAPKCIAHSMFFWSHSDYEQSDAGKKMPANQIAPRSHVNEEEAERCIRLALFLIQNGHKPSDVTIIAAYLGQVHLLRKKMRDARVKHSDLFPDDGVTKSGDKPAFNNNGVVIQTIDNYQGDENQIVIISLVRSNPRGDIGFLKTQNRRCVAQSRAKCGMYFVGNSDVIGASPTWSPVINEMRGQGLVGTSMSLCCPYHQEFIIEATSGSDTPVGVFCRRPCMIPMRSCQLHPCPKACQPKHHDEHVLCVKDVRFKFPRCGHNSMKKCHQKVESLLCREQVLFCFSKCGHITVKECHVRESLMLCEEEVTFSYTPCGHGGTKLCHQDGTKMLCEKIVRFEYIRCKHSDTKKCHIDESVCKCKRSVEHQFPCGHKITKKCHEDASKWTCAEKVTKRRHCGHDFVVGCTEDVNKVNLVCRQVVSFTKDCGHSIEKMCYQNALTINCKETVMYRFPCGHKMPKICHEDASKWSCSEKVTKRRRCGHDFVVGCTEDVNKVSLFCRQVVSFTKSCGHSIQKMCSENALTINCKETVMYRFPCGHKMPKICHENASKWSCSEKVTKRRRCGHDFVVGCTEDVNKRVCQEVVDYVMNCGHNIKKKCYENGILLKCKRQVDFTQQCGHSATKLCHQSDDAIACMQPCKKVYRSCKHPCDGLCSQPCETKCKICVKQRQIEEETKRKTEERAKKQQLEDIEKELANLKKTGPKFFTVELTKDGSRAAEYYEVYDMVVKYIQPMHNWVPTVTKIEKVYNTELYEKFLKCKKTLFAPSLVQKKFHGTTADATQSIIKTGFRMPAPNNQMYGPGVYFATDSSKSAQAIYTKGSGMLLLCEVALGKPYTANIALKDMTLSKLKQLGCDSVFAPRGSAVKNDEFIVYNPDQTLPKYVIYYKTTGLSAITVTPPPTANPIQKYNIKPTRRFDPSDTLQIHFRIVESQIHRLRQKYAAQNPLPEIKSIDYIVNSPLVTKFQGKKSLLEQKYGKGKPETETVLAFHGTPAQALDNIVKNNFDLKYVKRTAHGFGIYFSEFPDVSLGYGNGLLLCQVLPGNAYNGSVGPTGPIPPGFHSIAVRPDSQGRAEMIVIDQMDQILPCYIVHF